MSIIPRTKRHVRRVLAEPCTKPTSILGSSVGARAELRTRPLSTGVVEREANAEGVEPAEHLLVDLHPPGPDGTTSRVTWGSVGSITFSISGEALGELRIVEQAIRDVDRNAEAVSGLRPLLRRVERVRDDEERQFADDRGALDVRHELCRRRSTPSGRRDG